MSALTVASATKVLSKPLGELASRGGEVFQSQLIKWKNVNARKQLARKVVSLESVKTFWQRDKSVPLSTFYFPNKVAIGNSRPFTVDSLAVLPRNGNFAIVGTIGQGKSILLRYLCIQELTPKGTNRIPLLIEFRLVTEQGLVYEMQSALRRLGFIVDNRTFDFYLRSGQLVLLLDAFDELDEKLVKPVIKELEHLVESNDSLQIFVTSRPHSEVLNSRHFQSIKIAPLSPAEHDPFLRRIGLTQQEANRLLVATRSAGSGVHRLLTTPLVLTLLVVVYQSQQQVPSDVPEFYQKLFETLFSKHDSSKPGFNRMHKSGLSERRLQQLFEAFCFCVLQNKLKTVLTKEEFNKCFDTATKYVEHECEVEGFRFDVVKVTCLMQEEGFAFHFLHKSVLEYFAASFMQSRTETVAQKFYSQVLSGRWFRWRQVIQFLSLIDKYRFTKYFEVPDIDEFFATFRLTPGFLPEDDRDLLGRLYGDTKIELFVDEDGDVGINEFGPFLTNNFRASQEFDLILLNKIVSLVSSRYAQRTRSEVTVSPGPLVKVWNEWFDLESLASLAQEVRKAMDRIEAYKTDCVEYLSAEDRKADLIEI